MALTDLTIRKAGVRPKPYRLWDKRRDGLGIQITPSASKTFFLAYRFAGKRRFFSIGRYPDIGLSAYRYRLL